MPYCKNCGAQVPEEAAFCPNCGTNLRSITPTVPSAKIELASWEERFLAWLIDFIIVQVFLTPLRFLVQLLMWPGMDMWNLFNVVGWGSTSLVFFLYWTFMEGLYGQSIGKIAMRIKVTRSQGQPIDVVYAAVESIGKAFLLPIDVMIGWILYPARKQRLFNYISDTVIVRI